MLQPWEGGIDDKLGGLEKEYWGHENLRYDINCKNFSAVQNYISMSDRFN